MKKTVAVVLLLSIFMLGSTTIPYSLSYAQSTLDCEQCGMDVDAMGQNRFQIVDSSGNQHIACCPICAFKLISKYEELNITSFCDYNGPDYPITITARLNGSELNISPQSALVILGGGCAKNRLVYDPQAADALLAPPNNGSSPWLSPLTNATVAYNATRMSLAKAVLQYAGGTNMTCEQCGMTVDVTGQQRFRIFDSTGTIHVACCPICALRLQRTYNDLNITATCDYYGPNYPITIVSRNNGTDVTVNPSTALIVVAGGCTKNRIVYNSTAADLLLAPPNNGTSQYLSPLQNDTAPANATRMIVAQAALANGAGTLTPTPTPPPTGGTIYECEACGMNVNPESQLRYRVTDANGNVHYVECFMCAMQLINDYETLHIETYCDWNGPSNPIVIDTTNYGQGSFTVSPTSAMYLRGGSCVTARAAFDQSAANNLLANGYSQYTSPEQRYALPSTTEVMTISDAIQNLYSAPKQTDNPTQLTLVLVAVAGVAFVAVAAVAFKKLNAKPKKA